MRKKIILITLSVLMMSCISFIRKYNIVNAFRYNIEALADGGDLGTEDFYLSKAKPREFSMSVKDAQRLGLSQSEIDGIKRWNTSIQAYECIYHCCWDAQYESDSCRPYSSTVNECGLCYPRQGLIGLWDYEREHRNDAFD